jgi:predicted amidohydrolase YtcJ
MLFTVKKRKWILNLSITIVLLMIPLQVPAQGSQSADSVLVNGKIYTVDAGRHWSQAVAIREGRFVAVGSDAEIRPYIGSGTRVIDLGGRMAMPGITDAHIHPLEGTMAALYGCTSDSGNTLQDILKRIGECAANRPAGTWIQGGVFPVQLLHSDPKLDRSLLDAVAPEHPVILRSSGGHTAWVNSRALELAGVNKDTPDPENGFIDRDEVSGEPNGILRESAGRLISAAIPDRTADQFAEAIEYFSHDLNRQGVTAIKDAATSRAELAAYAEADRRGVLSLRVATSLRWPTESLPMEKRMALVRDRDQYRTPRVNPDFAKIFVDGSAGARKAAYLEPYVSDDPQAADYYGEFLVDPEDLKQYLILLDKEGISVKMHCGGDAAVRAGLDAIAAARDANGASGIAHEISHPNIVHPDDIERFRPLNAIADLTPVFWYPHPVLRVLAKNLGKDRVRHMWQIRNFVNSGATAVYGSDWPAITPNTNPWRAMEAMVTRRDPDNDGAREQFAPEQSIDLAAAIEIFTRNGAYSMRMADSAGSIEVGKYADMIVLGSSLFDIPPEKIGDTQVALTLLEGKEVYRDTGLLP